MGVQAASVAMPTACLRVDLGTSASELDLDDAPFISSPTLSKVAAGRARTTRSPGSGPAVWRDLDAIGLPSPRGSGATAG
jgi:hypothetical protein